MHRGRRLSVMLKVSGASPRWIPRQCIDEYVRPTHHAFWHPI
ncbi:hypothetical protein [Sorangium sp. So ce341]